MWPDDWKVGATVSWKTGGEGHEFSVRRAKLEMLFNCPVVMLEGGSGHIEREAKGEAQAGDL